MKKIKHIYNLVIWRNICLIFFMVPIISCHSNSENQKEAPKILNVIKTSDINNWLCYDSLVENLEVVKLKMDKRYFIYEAKKIIVDKDSNYFILGGTSNVVMINRQGDYVNSFGAKGKGPGEYQEARDFCIFENQHVCILAGGHIFMYDKYSGNFESAIKIQITEERTFYPEFISQADSKSFFIWDSNPSNVADFKDKFDCLIRVNEKGKVIDKIYPRKNFIIEIGHLSSSFDGGTWIRPAEGTSTLIKAKGDKVNKEYEILFEDMLAPSDFFKKERDNPYSILNEYFNSDFIKFIYNIMDNDQYLHFSCVGKDYKFYSFFINKENGKVHAGILNEKNPTLVCSDSLYFYSFYQDNETNKPLTIDSVFREKISNRTLNQSYIFKYKIK